MPVHAGTSQEQLAASRPVSCVKWAGAGLEPAPLANPARRAAASVPTTALESRRPEIPSQRRPPIGVGRSAVDHLLVRFGVAGALRLGQRLLDLTEIVRSQLDLGCREVLVEPVQL